MYLSIEREKVHILEDKRLLRNQIHQFVFQMFSHFFGIFWTRMQFHLFSFLGESSALSISLWILMEIKDGSGLPVNAVFTVTFANITHHGVQGGVPGQKAQFLGSQKLLRIPV